MFSFSFSKIRLTSENMTTLIVSEGLESRACAVSVAISKKENTVIEVERKCMQKVSIVQAVCTEVGDSGLLWLSVHRGELGS